MPNSLIHIRRTTVISFHSSAVTCNNSKFKLFSASAIVYVGSQSLLCEASLAALKRSQCWHLSSWEASTIQKLPCLRSLWLRSSSRLLLKLSTGKNVQLHLMIFIIFPNSTVDRRACLRRSRKESRICDARDVRVSYFTLLFNYGMASLSSFRQH